MRLPMTTDRKRRQGILSVMWDRRPRLPIRFAQPRAAVPHDVSRSRWFNRPAGRLCHIRNASTAMTLIEILVVMGIMSLIVGAIAVASFGAQRRAQIKGTEGLLEKIAQGLGQYKYDHRMYVPSDDDGRTYPLWQALDGQYAIDVKAKFKYSEEGDTYADPRTGEDVQRYQYQDAWKMLIRYECNPPYQRFTLTSTGPDLEQGGGDDIERSE